MNIRDYFSEKEIRGLNKLPGRIKIDNWFSFVMSILLLIVSVIYFLIMYKLAKKAGVEDIFSVLGTNIDANKMYPGIVSLMNYCVVVGLLLLSISISNFIRLILIKKTLAFKLVKCWKLLISLSDENKDMSSEG